MNESASRTPCSLPIFSLYLSLSLPFCRFQFEENQSAIPLLRPASRGHACQYRVDTLVRSTLILFTRLLRLSPLGCCWTWFIPQNGSLLSLPSIRLLPSRGNFYCFQRLFFLDCIIAELIRNGSLLSRENFIVFNAFVLDCVSGADSKWISFFLFFLLIFCLSWENFNIF